MNITYQMLIDSDRSLRSAIKHHFCRPTRSGAAQPLPVIVKNDPESGVTGERGGWFTRGGTPIAHPGAYAKVGWSNMTYRCSTRVLEISEEYVAQNFAVELFGAAARTLSRLRREERRAARA